jgi:BirA family biotin operon repressor/biotin-[acetyl-CoA-carboxylase] ligase
MEEPASHLPYTPESIQSALGTTVIGRQLALYQQVGSTNDLAKEAGRRGEREGLVIAAEEQTAGRGRLGRVWSAPGGCCILCSVLLRPRFSSQYAFYLTIVASLAVYRACKALIDEEQIPQAPTVAIKWPNDVLIRGRKVVGVLSETEFSGEDWSFAVVGFGINVNLSAEELGGLRGAATSLAIELGGPVDRALLLARVLQELESLYLLLQNGQFSAVHSEWVGALETVGKHVMVTEAQDKVSGQAVRVDPDGALVIRTERGDEQRVLAGDVTTAEETD